MQIMKANKDIAIISVCASVRECLPTKTNQTF